MHPTMSMIGITKRYNAIAALTDVSFDVRPGEVHALLGENGAGKSTLMNVASGTTAPDAGTIIFDGSPVENLTPATPRSQRQEGDALAARRRPLPGPPRGPRLISERGPPPSPRACQGVRHLAAAPHSRRADGAALAGLRRAPLRLRPAARGGRNGRRLHHAPAGRGARDRGPRDRPSPPARAISSASPGWPATVSRRCCARSPGASGRPDRSTSPAVISHGARCSSAPPICPPTASPKA